MVCKEEVYLWFRGLKGSKRIEAMCCFLNMCFPLELRFYGTCLEDLGRKDFYVFREDESKANELSEVLKIRNIHDPVIRSKLIVVLSLLNSSNTICAKELFKVLSEEIKIETMENLGILFDMKIVEEYLLVLTIAQHHPAFSFDQQTFLTHLSISLQTYVSELYSRERTKCEEPASQNSFYSGKPLPPQGMPRDGFSNMSHPYRYVSPRYSDSSFNQVQITNLKVKPPHKKMCLRIRVAWGSNKITDAFKTPHDLLVFHQKLIQLYPAEAKNNNQDKCVPPLPHTIATWNKQNNLSENIISAAAEYVQQLNSRLPGYVLESDFVRNFFMPSFPNRAALTRNNRGSDPGQFDMPPRNSRLRSLTIYNSQISDNSPRHRPERQRAVPLPSQREEMKNGSSSVCVRPSPVNSPLESPLSSPYASPLNSETNSRAPSPWNQIAPPATLEQRNNVCPDGYPAEKVPGKDGPEHWDAVRNFKIEELQAMPISELENLGIVKTNRPKIKDCNMKSPPNGIVGSFVPRNALLLKSGPLPQPASNESSPVCSEYSSPPQSPSPSEPCNQSGSLSSGNEENNERRTHLKQPLNDLCTVEESGPIIHDSPFKRTEDDSVCMKGSMNRNSVSVIPFAVPYSSIITQLPPPQNMKPVYLPIPCRTNSVPQHLSPGAMVFDTQFSRVPLPSALTFLPPGPPRPHAATPDRVLSPPSMPISTVSPFPVVTSGCTTVPIASCSITTYRSSNNMTAVSHSGASSNRYVSKNTNMGRDADMCNKPSETPYATGYKPSETPYATGYILNTSSPLTAVSCSCFTTNSARPSPAPSPSLVSPGSQQQQPTAVPVSMSYLGMPYLFHSIPFQLQPQATANGFVPQNSLGQGYSYTPLPNGIAAISPELIYPGHTFALPSNQGNPCPVATPASQCYGFPQTAAVPIKLVSCYNCGKVGHRGLDCKEQTMDDVMSKPGKFHLNFAPVPKMPDSHE